MQEICGMSEFTHTAYFFVDIRKEVIIISRVYKTISYKDRQTIEKLLGDGMKVDSIATVIGVHRATIYRELRKRRDQNGENHADHAQRDLSR